MERDIQIFLISTTISIVAILAGVIVQLSYNSTQVKLKKYEVTFMQKHKAYVDLQQALDEIYRSIDVKGISTNQAIKLVKNVEAKYLVLEPLLDEDSRNIIWEKIQTYQKSYLTALDKIDLASKKNSLKEFTTIFINQTEEYEKNRNTIRQLLIKEFSNSSK